MGMQGHVRARYYGLSWEYSGLLEFLWATSMGPRAFFKGTRPMSPYFEGGVVCCFLWVNNDSELGPILGDRRICRG